MNICMCCMYVMPKNGQYDWNMQHVLTRLIAIVVVNVICLLSLYCNCTIRSIHYPEDCYLHAF